jgi:hypothetical protein
MFCILWSATMYAYTKALDPDFINASDVFALYSTHYSFLYMLSWIVLFTWVQNRQVFGLFNLKFCLYRISFYPGFGLCRSHCTSTFVYHCSHIFALYSTHYSFLYMLSWIVLFEMFVAMRVSTHVYTRLSTHAYT